MSVTKEALRAVLARIKTDTKIDVIRINYIDESTRLLDSKFGGLPYLPKDVLPPVDHNGRQLRLLAQINMKDLPYNSLFPEEGILQFWLLNDDFAGVDFEKYSTSDSSRVIFWENIDTAVTMDDVRAKYNPFRMPGLDYFPVDGEIKLEFSSSMEAMSIEDYRFQKAFRDAWIKLYPDADKVDFNELPEELQDVVFDSLSGFGNKILGYPAFTQEDPRIYEDGFDKYDTLLLQIDSGGTENCDIMWGDNGIGNFFIPKSALLKRDFTKAIYTWDCC